MLPIDWILVLCFVLLLVNQVKQGCKIEFLEKKRNKK